MTTHPRKSNAIGATRLSFQVIETLRELDGGRVSEVADHLGIATSTAHSHLSTLHELEYVAKTGDEYHVGLRFLGLGRHAVTHNSVHPIFEEVVRDLAEETEERVQFCIEEHGLGVFVDSTTGEHGIYTSTPVGARVHLHQIAAGKSILAFLPEPRVEMIVERRGLPTSTEHTVTNRDELFEQLETIRERGYAFNREEYMEGVNAIGAPVRDQHDRVVGAIGIAAPAHRMTGEVFESEYPTKLLGAINEMEINLAYSG